MAVRHSNVVVVKRLIMTSVAAAILKLCASLLLMMVNTIQFDRIVLVKNKMLNIWFLSPLVPSKQEKNIQTETN